MRLVLAAAALVLLGIIAACVYSPYPIQEDVVIVPRPWKHGDCWQHDDHWYCRGYDRHHGDEDEGDDDD